MSSETPMVSLGYITLTDTLKEVSATSNKMLSKKIERVLKENQLPKPRLHQFPNDISTSSYRIDLTRDEIDEIISVILDLEAQFVSEHGETTARASFYASLVDAWASCIDYEV